MDFNKIASIIAQQTNEHLKKTINKGTTSDPYWNLETVIIKALEYVEKKTEQKVRKEFFTIMKEFDKDNGSTRN